MLVNAIQFPVQALWQGIMLLLLIPLMLLVFKYDKPKIAFWGYGSIGLFLMMLFIYLQ